MTDITVHTAHETHLKAVCLQKDCIWTYHGARAELRAQQHSIKLGHITKFIRKKIKTYTPTNLRS